MPLSPALVVFDLDDTLLDHRAAERDALADVHRLHADHLGHHDLGHVQSTYHAANAPLWADFAAGTLTASDLKRLRSQRTLDALGVGALSAETFNRDYLDRYARRWRWTPGAEAAFHAIADALPVGVLTNGFSAQQRGKLARFPALAERSAVVVISEEVGVMKPDPALFDHVRALASDTLGSPVAPTDILYVGDSYRSDVVGGTGAGWPVAWFGGDPGQAPDGVVCFDAWPELLDRLGIG